MGVIGPTNKRGATAKKLNVAFMTLSKVWASLRHTHAGLLSGVTGRGVVVGQREARFLASAPVLALWLASYAPNVMLSLACPCLDFFC